MKKLSAVILVLLLIPFAACSQIRFMNENEIKDIDEVQGTIIFSYTEDDVPKEYSMDFVLYYQKAPITVTNFVKLAKDGFYNGSYCLGYSTNDGFEYLNADVLEYNNTEPKELVQKELDYYIKGEFSKNGWDKNDLEVKMGTMYMIRDEAYDTADSAFTICLSSDGYEYVKGEYAVFGKMTVDSAFFNSFQHFSGDLNSIDFKIKSITINTQTDLGEPLKISK